MSSPSYLIVALCFAPSLVAFSQLDNSSYRGHILQVGAVSLVSFVLAYYLIPPITQMNLRADLYGIDINKKGINPEADKDPKKMYVMRMGWFLWPLKKDSLGTDTPICTVRLAVPRLRASYPPPSF